MTEYISSPKFEKPMSSASFILLIILIPLTAYQRTGYHTLDNSGSMLVYLPEIFPGSDIRQVPVILVGNKIDLRGGEVTNEALEEEIIPIMNEFKV